MKKIENFLKKYKNSFSFLSILVALFALIYSSINTRLTYKALKFEYKTYDEKNLPVFDFSIIRTENNIDNEYISIVTKNETVSLNSVKLFYQSGQSHNFFDIITPIKYNLKVLKKDLVEELRGFYCDDCFFYSEYTIIPLAARINYFQFGIEKQITGLFKLTCKVYLHKENFKISIQNIELLKYYGNPNDSIYWADIVDFSYRYGYKNYLKEKYIDNKIEENLKYNIKYQPVYSLINLLSKYNDYNVNYQPVDSNVSYSFYFFLKNDSLISMYSDLLKNSNETYRILKKEKTNIENDYKNLTQYLQKQKLPFDKSFSSIINSNWVNHEFIDSIEYYKIMLKETLVNSLKLVPEP